MIKAVLDTNILISALLSPAGAPAKVFDHVLNGNVSMCFDSNIIAEYKEVLARPKFGFNSKSVNQVINFILQSGISIVPEPLNIDFINEDDKIFYEVAVSVKGLLVTGNAKHYPKEPIVVTAGEFLEIIKKDLAFRL
jgi:putative PIN family toxin of toxin-antitoxin system